MTSLERARHDLWTFAFLLGFLFALVMRLTRHLDEHQADVDELAATAAGAVVAAAAAAAEAQARTPERVFIVQPEGGPHGLAQLDDEPGAA